MIIIWLVLNIHAILQLQNNNINQSLVKLRLRLPSAKIGDEGVTLTEGTWRVSDRGGEVGGVSVMGGVLVGGLARMLVDGGEVLAGEVLAWEGVVGVDGLEEERGGKMDVEEEERSELEDVEAIVRDRICWSICKDKNENPLQTAQIMLTQNYDIITCHCENVRVFFSLFFFPQKRFFFVHRSCWGVIFLRLPPKSRPKKNCRQ